MKIWYEFPRPVTGAEGFYEMLKANWKKVGKPDSELVIKAPTRGTSEFKYSIVGHMYADMLRTIEMVEGILQAEREGYDAAIYATQDCCIFCYGYLALNNIAHQALREDPWPTTMWRHPNNLFRLASGYAAIGNLISNTHNGTSRYWQVYT